MEMFDALELFVKDVQHEKTETYPWWYTPRGELPIHSYVSDFFGKNWSNQIWIKKAH